MPRKKQESTLPEDLQKIVDDDSQEDLRDPEQIEQEKLNMAQAERLTAAYRMMAASPHGAAVFRHILWLCGFHSPIVTFSRDTFELNEKASIYNASKRDIWLEIRKHFPSELLRAIENPLEVTHV